MNVDYLDSVRREVKTQIRRLQHHASVALWAGNNENEAALRDNWYGTGGDFERYKADYITLYVDVIKELVEAEDPSKPFVVSSPSNGLRTEQEGFVAAWPGDPRWGDSEKLYSAFVLFTLMIVCKTVWDLSLFSSLLQLHV